MAGVGGGHAAGLLVAIERQRIAADLLAPEGVLEVLLQLVRLLGEAHGQHRVAQRARQQRGRAPRLVDVALHLAQRDRWLGQAPVGMEHRVLRVFPALLYQAFVAAPAVFDEAVAVEVAVAVDPLQRQQHLRPDAADEFEVAGARVVGAGQQHEQRRGVHRAVVAAERNLAGGRHLALARLVQDLARLGIALRVLLGGLRGGEEAEHAARQRRVDPQELERSEDAVAPEGGGVPRYAGVRIGAGTQVGGEHREIGQRALDPQVDQRVRCFEAAQLVHRRMALAVVAAHGVLVAHGARPSLDVGLAAHGAVQVHLLLGIEAQVELGQPRAQPRRGGLELHARAPIAGIQPAVGQQHLVGPHHVGPALAAALADHAAHLEQVDEIGIEAQRELRTHRLAAMVGDADVLVTRGLPQQLGAEDVQRALGHAHGLPVGRAQVGVHQLDDQQAVVVLRARAQVHRAHAVDQQQLLRQVARVLVVQALVAGTERLQVAEAIEHHEGLAVLEHLRVVVDARLGDGDVPLVTDLDGIGHGEPPSL